MEQPTVVMLPETNGDTLCVSYHKVVEKTDYLTFMDEPLHKIIAEHGHFNLLVHFAEDFSGWDADAADANFKTINKTGPVAKRLAYVNPPESKMFQVTLQRFMWPAQICFFNDADLAEALDWVKAA